MEPNVSHLQPDGTTFPPVTPDPPPPPGYEPPTVLDPLEQEQEPSEDDLEPAPAPGSTSGKQEPPD